LIRHVAVRGLAGFGNQLFAAFAPAAHAIAHDVTSSLLAQDSALAQPFPGAWTTAAFGVGPRIVGDTHHPSAAPWCWVALTALGNFDHQRGGHLIFWDLGRILEFPPGATILLPPLLRYTVADIQEGETRYTLAQY
ncbi:hypothetical protein C8F04DRAFT_889615, partial [Mycena alexandri]